jgi:membrane-bound lytic murein transglycosylase C
LEDKQAFEKFKQEVEEKWEEFKSASQKEYVEYDSKKQSRTSIDFEKGTIIIEVLLEEGESAGKAQQKLEEVTVKIVKSKGIDDKPILKNQLESSKKEKVTVDNIQQLSSELIKKDKIQIEKNHRGNDGTKRTKFTVVIPMKKKHMEERAKRYESIVMKYSEKFNINPAIVFAIIETESAFNPKAKSHIPAYGLMQLVPKSGARDAYLYLYKKDKFLSKRYLYKPDKNIELGCAYLAKIRYVYYKDIIDDQKAYLCAIPAYNTGIGNVSKTLSGTTKLKPAAKAANKMSSKKLYGKLTTELQYKEARNYLIRVWERKDKYEI